MHSDNIRRMLANRNNGTFLPFSNEAHRLVKGYLTYTRDLAFYNTDEHLVRFLSEADNSNGTFPTLSIPDVEEMMQRAGMTINAWVPTAYSNPYGKLCCLFCKCTLFLLVLMIFLSHFTVFVSYRGNKAL